jgi:hypothetical protein
MAIGVLSRVKSPRPGPELSRAIHRPAEAMTLDLILRIPRSLHKVWRLRREMRWREMRKVRDRGQDKWYLAARSSSHSSPWTRSQYEKFIYLPRWSQPVKNTNSFFGPLKGCIKHRGVSNHSTNKASGFPSTNH